MLEKSDGSTVLDMLKILLLINEVVRLGACLGRHCEDFKFLLFLIASHAIPPTNHERMPTLTAAQEILRCFSSVYALRPGPFLSWLVVWLILGTYTFELIYFMGNSDA